MNEKMEDRENGEFRIMENEKGRKGASKKYIVQFGALLSFSSI